QGGGGLVDKQQDFIKKNLCEKLINLERILNSKIRSNLARLNKFWRKKFANDKSNSILVIFFRLAFKSKLNISAFSRFKGHS
ncbi:hypothetical protein BpHYR1_011079, partial [Brachionus plicatilis]